MAGATFVPKGNQNLMLPSLSPKEQQAKATGADISAYIGYINLGRSHEEAIELAGGSLANVLHLVSDTIHSLDG